MFKNVGGRGSLDILRGKSLKGFSLMKSAAVVRKVFLQQKMECDYCIL